MAHRLLDRSVEIPGEGARVRARAIDACRRTLGPSRPPTRVRILKYTARSAVLRLDDAGPEGRAVIAKRADPAALRLERTVYTEILPHLSLPGIRCHGMSEDESEAWLFVDDAGPGNCWPAEHPDAVARWLADMHAGASALALAARLPSRSSEHYHEHLQSALQLISANRRNLSVTGADRRLLDHLLSELDTVARRWAALIAPADGLPHTFVHGDLKASNIRLRAADGLSGVVVFDWEQCGWGTPASDLGVLGFHLGLCQYWATLAGRWRGVRATDLAYAARLGRLFRILAAIHWASTHLPYAWSEDSVWKLRFYLPELGLILAGMRPRLCRNPRSAHGRPGADRLVEGLSAVLCRPSADHRTVTVLERVAALPEGSSTADIVRCRTPNGTEHRVFCKYPARDEHRRFGHRGGLVREAYVYEHLLTAPEAPRTVRCHGSHVGVDGRRWLVLEYLDPSERMDRTAHTDVIYSAARWIAEFHASQQPPAGSPHALPLSRYDLQYYMGWVDRTHRYSAISPELDWLADACEDTARIFQPLLHAPPTVIHGEYYPKNIMLRDGQVYPVDWESAAIAPGEIDVASLTEGWPRPVAARCENEYARVRWPSGTPEHFGATLAAARIYLHFRWLGDDPAHTITQRLRWRFASLRALLSAELPQSP